MLESTEDCDLDGIYPSTSSSTVLRRSPKAVSDNVSGWDEVVEFYHTNSSEPGPSLYGSTRKRPHSEMHGAHVGEIKFSKNTGNGCTVSCPICEYQIKSNYPRDSERTLGKLVKHLLNHEGELDSSQKASCMLCFNFFSKAKLAEHYREYHGESPEKYSTADVIYFTNSVNHYQDLIDIYSQSRDIDLSVVGTCSQIPESSFFIGYPTSKSLERCRTKWRQKFLSTSEAKVLFRFRVSRHSTTPFAWFCPLCEDSAAFSKCSSFSNDISLRLFILRHFSVEHEEEDSISSILREEWKILAREIGFELSYYAISSAKLLRQTQRTSYFYTLRSLQRVDKETLVYEMISRSTEKEEVSSSQFVICAVCFNPVRRRFLFRHFSLCEHKLLKVHAEESEFREVSEIAEDSVITTENFPYVALQYSKVYRIKELGDAESLTFMKWRCIVPSDVSGHTDDVLEFPTVHLLKIHALKHFQTYHDRVFNEAFFDYEWEVLKKEFPSSVHVRSYSPLGHRFNDDVFDTTNPNHFCVPFKAELLPKSFSDLQICGFCFWCGYSSQFSGHILCHGFIDTGISLDENSAKSNSTLLRSFNEPGDTNNVELEIPTKILGSAGRDVLRRLFESEKFPPTLSNLHHSTVTKCQESATADETAKSVDTTNDTVESVASNSNSEKCVADSTTPVGEDVDDESDTSSINDLSICNENSGQKSQHLPVNDTEDAALAHTCTSSSVSVANPLQTVSSTSNDLDDKMDGSINTDNVSSYNVEAHKLSIQRKFVWEGPPPPPLDSKQTEQLMMLSRNECPFCETAHGARGLRIPAFANDEIKEESMIAHVVRFHHDDPEATWVLDAKKYRLSVGERMNPLKFLMEPSPEGSLVCSSCEKASFPKLANLRVHWIRCVQVCGQYRRDRRLGRLVLESPSVPSTSQKRRSKNHPVKCPVQGCISAWRPSFVYPNAVGQISHILARHLIDKQAYDIAVQIGNTECLDTAFPYLNVSKSFANTMNHPKALCLQCSKCEHGFRAPNELVQHAKRYHPTEEHYSGAPKCPFTCDKKVQRRFSAMPDGILRLIHVFKNHLDMEEAVTWIQNWPERFGSIMQNEQVYKFDVLESLESSISAASPLISCFFCKELIPIEKYLRWHRKPGSRCYDETNGTKSGKIMALFDRSKAIASRVLPNSSKEKIKENVSLGRRMRQCDYCSRAVPLSENYCEEISILLHVIHAHMQNEVAVKWLKSRDYFACLKEYPYIDIVASCDASCKLGKPALHCGVCNFKTDTSRRMMHHARLHEELMRSDGNYPDPCNVCEDLIPVCSQVKESFQRVCHFLMKHAEDVDLIRSAVNAYEIDHSMKNDIKLLNVQRSLELRSSSAGRPMFACNQCDFRSYNSYALIQHGKIHDTSETAKKTQTLKRKSPTVCSYCNRMLLCSTRYSPRITLLTHFVKFHRLSQDAVKDFAVKCASWNVASEFPYIDPVVSIKQGKLQCAVCEASLLDIPQMLKHATTVHETYQPHTSNDDVSMEGDLSLHQPESAEVDQITCGNQPEAANKGDTVGSAPRGFDESAPSVPINHDRQNDTSGSTDGRKSETSYGLRTPKKELKVRSVRRYSRTYAPSNNLIPRLPSSSDEEVNRQCNPEDLLKYEISLTLNTHGSQSFEPEVFAESTKHQTQGDQRRSNTLSSNDQVVAQPSCSSADLDNNMSSKVSDIEPASQPVPLTSTPKSVKPDEKDKAGSILAWLTPINRSIVPSRRAQLITESKVGSSMEGNIRDALDNAAAISDSAAFRIEPQGHISHDGTLFDELPQRIVQKIAKQSKPPEDISHIKGAKGYPCNFCGFKARSVGDIRRHTSLAHSEILPSLTTKIVSPCHLCNDVFEKRSLLLKHITDFHADVPEPFKCAYCPKTYATSRGMREHERRSHESRLFLDPINLVCPHCDKEFDSKRNRDEHVRRHKNPDSSLGRGF